MSPNTPPRNRVSLRNPISGRSTRNLLAFFAVGLIASLGCREAARPPKTASVPSESAPESAPAPAAQRFRVYAEHGSKEHRFAPSGHLGDFAGTAKMDMAWAEQPHDGKTCVKVTYSPKDATSWCGAYWLHPAKNWGDQPGGHDLRAATRLTFWARGENGGETVEFKLGGLPGEFGDTAEATTGPIKLPPEWREHSIPLAGLNLSRVVGGFAWLVTAADNPDGCTFYLDDIAYDLAK